MGRFYLIIGRFEYVFHGNDIGNYNYEKNNRLFINDFSFFSNRL